MKTLSTFLLFFFYFQFIYGQVNISKKIHQKINSDGVWENHEAIDYSYDEWGNTIEEFTLKYDPDKQSWQPFRKKKMEYDESENITRLYWENIDSTGNWSKSKTEYVWEYNEDNCLIKKEIINPPYAYWIWGNYYLTEYHYLENCKIDKQIERDIYIEPDSTIGFESIKTFQYRYENNDRKIIQDLFHEWGESLSQSMENARIREIDEYGRTISYIDSLTDIGAEKQEYEYYSSGKMKSRDLFLGSINGWRHVESKDYRYSYNDKGLLVSTTSETDINPPFNSLITSTIDYDYFCDNLLSTEFTATDKYIYIYDSPTDCFDLKAEGIDYLVFPNPTDNKVHIYSTAFQSGALTVSIFDSKGGMVYRKKMEGREENLEVDVRQFVTGVYFVNLTGLGETKTVKLLVKP